MPSKISHKIVLAPFPFDDLSVEKMRPALLLSRVIGVHRQVVLAYLTSKTPPQLLATDLVLDGADADFALTGLKTTSTLRLHLLYTIDNALIARDLGVLPERLVPEVEARLRSLFDL